MAMRFGIRHSAWLDTPDPAESFEAVKAKAPWAEDHGFVWFSVMDHMIQIPRVGAPDEPVLEGWTVRAGLAAVTRHLRLATLCTAVGHEYRQYGWEFPLQPATRIRQMEEAVQLILKMWTEPRTTFHGQYFHVEDAILEPKPRPPVMIAGGGEQLTLRAVARLADACNLVGGGIAEVRNNLAVLRRHCDAAGRDDDAIEKTHVQHWLLARGAAAVAAKRERLAARGPLPGFVGTVSEAIGLIGQYRDAGVERLIHSDRRNDVETRELFVSDVMPRFPG